MKKYIDAELLKSELGNFIDDENIESNERYYWEIFDIINNQPAADVEEVKHGKWIKTGKTNPEAVCSECGRKVEYQAVNYVWEYENYCPHCGAKMDR